MFNGEGSQNYFLHKHNEKYYEFLFHLFFVCLLLISYFQYLERTLLFDGAFYCFKILSTGNFNIENGRWGAFYNQILPLLGLKFNCSLNTFLKLYSVSFALCNYIFFLIIYYHFKQPLTALAFVFLQVVMYRYNFYYSVSEIHATIGPSFLLFAMINSEYNTKIKKVIGHFGIIVIVFWLLNIHLLSFCIIIFLFIFSFINNKSLMKEYWLYLPLLFSACLFIYLISQIDNGSYQKEKLIDLNTIKFVMKNLNQVEGFKFLKEELHNYIIAILMFTTLIIHYLLAKKITKLCLILGATLCFFIIEMGHTVKYESNITVSNYYPLFGFFIILPLITDYFKVLRFKIAFPITTFILIVSIFKILKCGILITEQIDYFKRTTDNLRSYKERKFIVSEKNMDWDKIWMNWDICFQSLIVSSLNNPDSALTFITLKDTSKYKERTFKDSTAFIGVSFAPFLYPTTTFPKKFFHLKNTSYRIVTTNPDISFKTEYFTDNNLKINFPVKKLVLLQCWYRTIPVELINLSSQKLPVFLSDQFRFTLDYELVDIENGVIISQGNSPLEVDLPPHQKVITGLKVDLLNLKKGSYFLDVGLKFNGNISVCSKKRLKITIL